MKYIFSFLLLTCLAFGQSEFTSVAIDSGASTSSSAYIGLSSYDAALGRTASVVGIDLPSAFVGDSLTVEVKNLSGANAWLPLYNGESQLRISAAASRHISFDFYEIIGDSIRIKSGGFNADVQTSDITISIQKVKH